MGSLEEELKIICVKLLIKLIEADELIIEELKNLIPTLDNQRQKYKAFKTTGIGIAAVGSVITIGSLILAPFTLGLSLTVPLLAASTTATVAGGLTTAATSIRDGILTKRFIQQIQSLQNEQLDLATNVFNAIYELIKYQAEKLIMQGENSSDAVFKVIAKLTANCDNSSLFQTKDFLSKGQAFIDSETQENHSRATTPVEGPNDVIEVSAAEAKGNTSDFEAAIENAEEAKDEETPKDFNYQANKKITIGGLTITKNVGTAVVSIPQAQSKILAEIFRSSGVSVGGTVAGTVIQSVFAGFGAIFTIVDITILASNWDKSHPLIPEVHKIVKAIENHIDECKKLVNAINNNKD